MAQVHSAICHPALEEKGETGDTLQTEGTTPGLHSVNVGRLGRPISGRWVIFQSFNSCVHGLRDLKKGDCLPHPCGVLAHKEV